MQAVIEAEQALLGAVLSDPAGQHHILDLVETGDLRRPWHGQVLAAMQRLSGRGLLPAPTEVYQELLNDPDLPRSVALDAVPLIALMEAAPRPAHAPAYAAIVVEAGIRQRLRQAGSRIAQAAESGDLEGALSQAARTRLDLGACAARWSALPAPLRRETAVPATGAHVPTPGGTPARRSGQKEIYNASTGDHPPATVDQVAGTANLPAAFPGPQTAQMPDGRTSPSGSEARVASARALLNLIDDPSQLAAVRQWLRPEHFVPAANRAVYTLLQDMHAAGQPIDPVTVAWEAARRGLHTDPGRLAGGVGPFAVWSAHEVYHLGTLAQAADAGNAIQSDAADPARPPGPLMRSVCDRLQALPDEPQVRHEIPVTLATTPITRQPEREATR
jgi:DnaB-like helicase N terminal domain